MTSSSPRLAAADRLLLRHVFAWSRAKGWRRGGVPNYHWWLDPDGREVVWSYDADDRDAWTLVTNVIPAEACVDSVAQAVDVLVALGILPAQFSSVWDVARVKGFDTGYACGYDQGRDDEAAGAPLPVGRARYDG